MKLKEMEAYSSTLGLQPYLLAYWLIYLSVRIMLLNLISSFFPDSGLVSFQQQKIEDFFLVFDKDRNGYVSAKEIFKVK